ncbi:helix-turn-helix domain-containing protein [Nannocystis pusilla]|uniref:AraC-like ligand-binding domain-containing protein n=1 Tax=Nannocystis pusilla TaxID=889268 RepID=UPI003DA38FC3
MQLRFDTSTVPEKSRLEFWQDVSSRTFVGMRMEPLSERPFFGELAARKVGTLGLTHLRSAAKRVFRGSAEIASSSRDCYVVCMQLTGTCVLRQGRHERLARTGDLELFDGTRPGTLLFTADYQRIVVTIPRHELAPLLAAPEDAPGVVIPGDSGAGDLLSTYLRAFARNDLPEPVVGSASDVLVRLVAVAFNASRLGGEVAKVSVEEGWREKIRGYVERNLANPSLRPETVARHFGIGKRYLHELFARTDQSFMAWVLARRLERCAEALRDPALRSRTIADIAFAWGFTDLSHFGRNFKARFGATPREWRGRATRNA